MVIPIAFDLLLSEYLSRIKSEYTEGKNPDAFVPHCFINICAGEPRQSIVQLSNEVVAVVLRHAHKRAPHDYELHLGEQVGWGQGESKWGLLCRHCALSFSAVRLCLLSAHTDRSGLVLPSYL